MPATPHVEKHFTGSETVRDIVIGMSDGLTVPFALAAGLTGAVASTGIVVTAGFAEIAAGSIAMGLGGYLAAKSEMNHYEAERRRESHECEIVPEKEEEEVAAVLRDFGMSETELVPVVKAIRSDRKRWVDFMMRFELGLEQPDPRRARQSAFTIALSYIVGGLVPLASYIFIKDIQTALYASVVMTLIALFFFGFVKGHFTGISKFKSGFQTTLIGGLAAAAAFGIARAIA
ncbi:MAG: VIT1/CCC1 transporter family protein [bacterium]|nr:VIT1/CCC1 transporter family protein [bacterium]